MARFVVLWWLILENSVETPILLSKFTKRMFREQGPNSYLLFFLGPTPYRLRANSSCTPQQVGNRRCKIQKPSFGKQFFVSENQKKGSPIFNPSNRFKGLHFLGATTHPPGAWCRPLNLTPPELVPKAQRSHTLDQMIIIFGGIVW